MNGSDSTLDEGKKTATIADRSSSPLLFEVAWEVCNQIGGIYTVIKTKAPAMIDRWGKDYYLVGPYNPQNASIEFEETPPEEPFRTVIKKFELAGIQIYHGRWLIAGRPNVILLDFRPGFLVLDRDKYYLWKDHGIPTVQDDNEVNESVAFGFIVAEFFRQLGQAARGRPIVAHFHEWMAGVAVPRIAHWKLPIRTVFTTHATLLGRYIASDNPNFYEQLDHINPDHAAAHYNITPRYSIEKCAAHASNVFTTISDITAREAEKFLGRKADFILPNGINIQRFTALHEFQNLHLKYKEAIQNFVMGHFFPSYTSWRALWTHRDTDTFAQ